MVGSNADSKLVGLKIKECFSQLSLLLKLNETKELTVPKSDFRLNPAPESSALESNRKDIWNARLL